MTLEHSLSATVERSSLREPDSDGDTRLEGHIIVKTNKDQVLELFITQQVLRGSDGAVVSSSKDEREDSLEPGEELRIDLDSGYFKATAFSDSSKANIDIEILGCKADFAQLPTVGLGDGLPGLYGWNHAIRLGSDVIVESLAVGVKPADDDGDVRVELRALVYNSSMHQVPRFTFKARAIAAGGREIDDQSTYEVIAPGERKVVEVSFYSIKANRMRGLSIATDATAFSIQGKANSCCAIDVVYSS